MNDKKPILSASHICKTFGTLKVLKGIDVAIYPQEIVAIIGPSGAGKTTLLQILGLLDRPDAGGDVRIENVETASLSRKELAEMRNRKLGFVFQAHQLLPEFTAIENVMIPAFIARRPKKEAQKDASELLSYLGLSDRFAHKPAELSGGEKQRVAVARALINKPSIILADEPTGSLDSKHKEELHNLLYRLRNDIGQTFLVVTHDDTLSAGCDRTIRLSDGLIVDDGFV